VVDVLGAEMTINGVACDTASVPFSVPGGPTPCACKGDVSGPSGVPDGAVSTSDMSALLAIIAPAPGFSVTPVPAGKECLDLSGPSGPVPDGTLSTSDMSALLAHIAPLPGFTGPCIP
jgi:hypothetical protein